MEALARAGVGKLILVDFDVFEPSNINRQILALSSTLGQKKVIVAQNRVKKINPDCEVILKDMFVTYENIDKIKDEGSAIFIKPRMDEGKAKFPSKEDIVLESLRTINLNKKD